MDVPSDNEVEVTLIGTGGGYGECVLLKLGKSSWFIIDSCINPTTKKPLAIEYFDSIGVDYKKDVVQIICTHWHDDHIQGLSQLLNECTNAEFCATRVNDIKKFLLFVAIDKEVNSKGGVRSTQEFGKCLKILNDRKATCTRLSSNMVVSKFQEGSIVFEIYSLSPSDYVVDNFDKEISTLIETVGEKSNTIIQKSPNEKSVALLIKFGDQRVLLGADLEVGNDPMEGWVDVLNNSKVTDGIKAQVFKIPHHGSENGYDIRIFQKLVNNNSILKLTPWNLMGDKLPVAMMLDTYKSHSTDLFITSPILSNKRPKSKKRKREIEKIIEDFNKTLEEVKFSDGIIRSRFNYLESSTWKTDIFNNAFKV